MPAVACHAYAMQLGCWLALAPATPALASTIGFQLLLRQV
jgi:hypothetical protein